MFKMPKWEARNPLGIIALFISLIYGMSALLLGTSIGKLEKWNETILVIFIVLFPCAVLTIFGWLVACHHRKLYGPGDFKNDDAFLVAGGLENSAELGAKYEAEIKEDISIANVNIDDAEQTSSDDVSELKESAQRLKFESNLLKDIPSEPIRRAYMAESLVFQDLQDEFKGFLRRETKIKTKSGFINVDGVVRGEGGDTIVEVKYTSNPSRIKPILRSACRKLKRFRNELIGEKYNFRAVLVLDGHKNPPNVHDILMDLHDEYGFDVAVSNFFGLLEKYGFSEGEEFAPKMHQNS